MFVNIKTYCAERINEFRQIEPDRKVLLKKVSEYIRSKVTVGNSANLVYICTHNSRRSHFGQIWATVAGDYFNIPGVKAYSGGTEATAFNSNAINALVRTGFVIGPAGSDKNPVYHVQYDEKSSPIACFSKVYDHPANPKEHVVAIMTCGDAEENCPFIPGVELRIATPYEDPKAFDGTPEQDAVYDERCKQIARETLYLFSKINL